MAVDSLTFRPLRDEIYVPSNESEWALSLLGPLDCGGSDAMPLPGPGLQRLEAYLLEGLLSKLRAVR